MRGLSYASVGKHREALRTFRRALELDPTTGWRRKGSGTSIARSISSKRPRTRNWSPWSIRKCACSTRRVAVDRSQADGRAAEGSQQPARLRPQPATGPAAQRALYWRAVAHLKISDIDHATEELTSVLDPAGYPPGDPQREKVLLQAWQLALQLHPEMQHASAGRNWHSPAGAWKRSASSNARWRRTSTTRQR